MENNESNFVGIKLIAQMRITQTGCVRECLPNGVSVGVDAPFWR